MRTGGSGLREENILEAARQNLHTVLAANPLQNKPRKLLNRTCRGDMRFFLLLTQYKFGAQQIQQLCRVVLNDLKTAAFLWPIHRKGAHHKMPARQECLL